MWFSHGFSVDLLFNTLILCLGFISFCLGGYFTYLSYFKQPQFSYLPVDDEWRSYLGELVNRAKTPSVASALPEAFFVDVSGAVERPGVYQISGESRVQDALLMAGGFLPQASQQFIHQELNLSRKIQDQEKIYVPLEGEEITSKAVKPSVQNTSSGETKISLDSASLEDLMALEGIGEKRAEAILAGYPYASEQDFLERSGLSRTLAQELLQSWITLE